MNRNFTIIIALNLLLLGVAGYLAMPKPDHAEAPVTVVNDGAAIQPSSQAQPVVEHPFVNESGGNPTRTAGTESAPAQNKADAQSSPNRTASASGGPLVASWEKAFQDAPVPTPAALADPDPTLELSEDQAVVWQRLRQNFIDSLGFQNPYDPNYLKRWAAAQPELDERFRAMFGDEAFSKQQSQASHQN